MSFVPAPQQANAAPSGPSTGSNNALTSSTNANAAAGAVAPTELSDQELIFKIRTFDVYWVEKHALMNRDGFAKVRSQLR